MTLPLTSRVLSVPTLVMLGCEAVRSVPVMFVLVKLVPLAFVKARVGNVEVPVTDSDPAETEP